MHSEFMAFVSDETTAAAVRNWAQRQGFPADTVQIGGAETLSALLESDEPPKLVLVDFDGQSQPVQIAARLVSLCGPSSRLIALGTANDVPLYRGLIAAGFQDYLVKPLTPELLTQSMLSSAHGVGGAHQEAKTILIISVRGGAGASTIATNVAWLIAHEMKKKCVLLDLDLQYGTSALALDLEPGHGLRDVVSSPQRVDSLMIAGALVSESENLGVLSAEETIEDLIHVDANAIAALLKEVRTNYAAIIIDLPRHMIPMQKRVLATAQEIVLVTEMSLVGIRDTLRMRMMLKNLGSTARITQVATRVGPNRPAAVDEAAFAKGAQAKIDFVIPDDHKNIIAASNAGKMLGALAASAPVTKALRDLAKYLLSDDEGVKSGKKAPTGLVGWFFTAPEKEAPKV